MLLVQLAALLVLPSCWAIDQFSQLRAKTAAATPLKLDDSSYHALTSGARDYASVVLLTARGVNFGCQVCREVEPDWNAIAKSWLRNDKDGSSRVIFGTLDFVDGKNTFQSLMLQTAPIILMFPPNTGPHAQAGGKPVRLDFTTGAQSAEHIHGWVERQVPTEFRQTFSRPPNYFRLASAITGFLGFITLLIVAAPWVMPLIQHRNLWTALSLIAIFGFTSGYMFNRIRKTPYVTGDGQGGVTYFAQGFQTQLGLESQVIAAIYAILAFAAISLAHKVPLIQDKGKRQMATLLWCALMWGMFSVLLSIFRFKNPSYPFGLPPF